MRLFIGLEVTDQIRESLTEVVAERLRVSDVATDVRWVDREMLHVTVKFLGEVSRERLAETTANFALAVGGVLPFNLTIDRLGCFPEHGAVRIVWAGCGIVPEQALQLSHEVEIASTQLGIECEQRHFIPHVTLGRSKKGLSSGFRNIVRRAVLRPVSMSVESVVLFESQLQPQGSRYRVVERWPLSKQR